MSYNISTMYIWKFFNENCVCPVCEIRKKMDADISEMYLSEAVMENEERKKVNKYGFCKDHYDLLYLGTNKLGLALQMQTRVKTIKSFIKEYTDVKKAQKHAKKIKERLNTCVICNTLNFNMERYYETIARLYKDDERFRTVAFKSIHGFCYNDYLNLINYAHKAGKFSSEFLTDLHTKQLSSTDDLLKQLSDFTMAFDYRAKSLPSKSASLSLKLTRVKTYGDKTNLPERK